MQWVFDVKEDDIYWCTADIGWVTGHSYSVYGPLAAGATVVMYEGAPNFPRGRSVVVDNREISSEHSIHSADRDPYIHKMG